MSNSQWTDALRAVFAKATTDTDFRRLCLSDPAAALREAAGLQLTANSAVRFSEREDGSSIVLPPFGADPDEILDAEILDGIAGAGTNYVNCSHNCVSVQYDC